MSDMKCPVCKGELYIFKSSTQDAIVCADCGFDGNTKLWEELIRTKELLDIESSEHEMCHTQMLKTTEKLERTRKALEVALAELQEIDGVCDDNKYTDNLYVGLDGQDTRNIALDVKKTITQITALEQKTTK